MASTSNYSLSVMAEIKGPDDGIMFTQVQTWVAMSYEQLVNLEEALGLAIINASISLGRDLIDAGSSRIAKK